MNKWRGLHEQDYHSPWLDGIRALCTICQQDCEADDVCYCCQRNAEVERLTAANEVLTFVAVKIGRASQQAWARIEAALAFCEQQAKDRSLYSDDREKYELAYIDGWNDALDRVEQFLRGESDE